MIAYDAAVIEEFAEALYAQAKWIVIRYCALGLLIGFVIGYGFAAAARLRGGEAVLGGVVALAGVVLGYFAGLARAFLLRLQAQQALCQVQIEKNTRGTAAGAMSA